VSSKLAIGCGVALLLGVFACAGVVAVLESSTSLPPSATPDVTAATDTTLVNKLPEPPATSRPVQTSPSDEGATKPKTWAQEIAARQKANAEAFQNLSIPQRGYAARVRAQTALPVFQNQSATPGDFGKLAPVEFLTIVSGDAAQFRCPTTNRVYILKGIDLDNLVSETPYSFDHVWECVGTAQYATVLGAKHRAPVLKRLDIEAVQIAMNAERETAAMANQLRTWQPSTGERVGIFQRLTIDDQNFGTTITIEECPGAPLEIPVELLSTNDLVAVRSLHGAPVRIASPEDRALLRAGHKHRPRQWSTADGKFTVDASFVSIAGTTLSIRRVDNAAKVEIDQRKLGDDEQKYLQTKAWKTEAPLER
jgi:hypothetical protein